MKTYTFIVVFFLSFSSLSLCEESRKVTYSGDKRSFWIVQDRQFIIPVVVVNDSTKSYTKIPQKFNNVKEKVFKNEK